MNLIRVIHNPIVYGNLLQKWPVSPHKWLNSPVMGCKYSEIDSLRKMGLGMTDARYKCGDPNLIFLSQVIHMFVVSHSASKCSYFARICCSHKDDLFVQLGGLHAL